MASNKFYQTILDTLQGETEELRTVSRERLDWAGPGALLELYRTTSGSERSALILAVGQVLREHAAPPNVLAQLIQVASSLDLAEVEPQVRELQAQPVAAKEPLRGAITNYLAFRKLALAPKTVAPSRGKKSPRRAAKVRAPRGNGRPKSG